MTEPITYYFSVKKVDDEDETLLITERPLSPIGSISLSVPIKLNISITDYKIYLIILSTIHKRTRDVKLLKVVKTEQELGQQVNYYIGEKSPAYELLEKYKDPLPCIIITNPINRMNDMEALLSPDFDFDDLGICGFYL